MQANILWSGIEYYSLENCIIDINDDVTVTSTIIGLYNNKIYRIEYQIRLNKAWEIYYCLVKSQFDNDIKINEFIKDQHTWSLNGKFQGRFNNCTDIDISLTPFTNSLPINRLKLVEGQEKEIDVIYIDLFAYSIKHLKQKYRRISPDVYKYENIPNDFEAKIKVDGEGFVIDYPQLFKRALKVPSHYSTKY